MPLEKKMQVFEGLKLAIGSKRAVFCWARYHHMYPEKHGSCLEYIQQNSENPRAFMEYTNREQRVFARYALMYMHTIHQLQKAARYK